MAEVLSQSQIDELLKNLNSGDMDVPEEPEKKIKSYNFRSPKRFTREQLKSIDNIYDNYSRLLSSFFTGILRMYSKVTLGPIEEQQYHEFNNALPDYVLMGMIDLNPADASLDDVNILMQVSTSVAFAVMDRLMGSLGENEQSYELDRDFTEIELALTENFMKQMISRLKESWSNYLEVNPELSSIETNARLLQTIGTDDTVVIVPLDVEIKDLKGSIVFCIPAMNLEEIMAKFSNRYSRMKKVDLEKEQERQEDILQSLRASPLELSVLLGETEIALKDIIRLQVDDVIPLNKKITDDVIIQVQDEPWFGGKFGIKNNKKAVKIDKVL